MMYQTRITTFFSMLLCGLSLLCACAPAPRAAPRIDAQYAMAMAEENVSFGQRFSGSQASKDSIDQIVAELKKLDKHGNAAILEKFTDVTPRGQIEFTNIVYTIPGESSKIVVIGAHHDTKKIATFAFVGANDGASGVAALLAMVKAISESGEKPPYTLKFYFFDGEECQDSYGDADGLHGSKNAVKRLTESNRIQDVKAMILLDMIGDRDLLITLPADTDPKLMKRSKESAERLGYSKHIRTLEYDLLDDHVPFADVGIPAIDLIDFDFGPRNIYWHSPLDTLDKISGESIKISADIALDVIWNL